MTARGETPSPELFLEPLGPQRVARALPNGGAVLPSDTDFGGFQSVRFPPRFYGVARRADFSERGRRQEGAGGERGSTVKTLPSSERRQVLGATQVVSVVSQTFSRGNGTGSRRERHRLETGAAPV